MKRIVVPAIAGSFVLLLCAPARAAANPMSIVAAPEDVVRAYIAAHPSAAGLGVFPGHTTPALFLAEVAAGSPESAGSFARGLRAGGVVLGRSPDRALGLVAAFGPWGPDDEKLTHLSFQRPGDLLVFEAMTSDQMAGLPIGTGSILIGVGAHLPVLVAVTGSDGVLRSSDTHRDGVITPYDLSATLLENFMSYGFHEKLPVAGSPVRAIPAPDAQAQLGALRARFERDAGSDRASSKTTAGFGIAAGFLGALAAWRKKRAVAFAFARAGSLVPLGYLISMFLPTGSGSVRSIPIGVAFGVGAIVRPRDTRKFCAAALLTTAAVIGVAEIASALRPNAEPALSFWGNPLQSWRFFGLRNHLGAFLAGSTIAGALLLRWNVAKTIAAVAIAMVIVGAPQLGANYIGVLTLAFASTFATLVLAQRRPKVWHSIAALAAAAIATILALLSDAINPVSHGGRAVASVRSGGLAAGWRIFHERLVLDYREVSGIGPAGYIAFVLIMAAMSVFFLWAWRRGAGDVHTRAAIIGLAAASFLTLFVEDSGFYTGGILALFPAIAITLALAGAADTTTR